MKMKCCLLPRAPSAAELCASRRGRCVMALEEELPFSILRNNWNGFVHDCVHT